MELTTEVCVIALVVAVALLWLLLASGRTEQSTTVIVAADMSPAAGADGSLSLQAVDDGLLELRHTAVPLLDGGTVNLIVTTTGTNVVITEKLGERGSGAAPQPMEAKATVRLATCHPHTIRFESQITGQWAVVTLTPTAGTATRVATRF